MLGTDSLGLNSVAPLWRQLMCLSDPLLSSFGGCRRRALSGSVVRRVLFPYLLRVLRGVVRFDSFPEISQRGERQPLGLACGPLLVVVGSVCPIGSFSLCLSAPGSMTFLWPVSAGCALSRLAGPASVFWASGSELACPSVWSLFRGSLGVGLRLPRLAPERFG